MRIKENNSSVLIDLPLVQASRLNNRYFNLALNDGAFDPYPDGTVTDGIVAKNSGNSDIRLAHGPLTKFDGALPDHIQHSMHSGLHDEDTGLRDFLAIFDRRLLQLQLRAERASILVSTADHAGDAAASLLSRLLQMVSHKGDDSRLLQLFLPLLSRSRSLSGLRDILSWWTGSDVRLHMDFSTMRAIDHDSLGRLASQPEDAVALGHGAILGRFGCTPMGHVSVYISVPNRCELDQLIDDKDGLKELRDLTAQYLRDRVPVTFFAALKRNELHAPRLSSDPKKADRLGAYHLLVPERHCDAVAHIKLTQISV